VTSSDSHTGRFTANTQITESVTSTETPNATFVATTQITESITSVDTVAGAFIANTNVSESITLSEVNIVQADYSGSIGVLILDYAPFLISSEASTPISDITINLYDIVDATVT
jgi:hypothetical protein